LSRVWRAPAGNITGISDVTVELSPKRLELLKDVTTGLRRVAMLWNAGDPAMTARYKVSGAAAQVLGISVEPVGVRVPEDFDPAFAAMARNRPDAIFVVTDGLTILNRHRVLEFAAANRLPAVYEELDSIARDGGLMYYAPDVDESFDRVADLIDRIVKGAAI
jgi:putative tryptophan/tyrosine transport system substrate-binding protein